MKNERRRRKKREEAQAAKVREEREITEAKLRLTALENQLRLITLLRGIEDGS